MPTTIEQQQQHTIQAATRQQAEHSVGILFWLASAGQIIAPWWSKKRDSQLRAFWKDSGHFAGAVYMIASKLTGVPRSVQPRDVAIKAHVKRADEFNMMLDEMPQFGKGWDEFWTRFLVDLWTTDCGAFGEVIGDGDPAGPIVGPPLGLAHLDSFNCHRTSNPEFPVVYFDASGDGKRYKLHYTRVIYTSQLPSPATEMYGVGHSWLTRAINIVQNLVDISIYKQEKMGSRPLRAILTGSGINVDAITGAIAMAEESMDNQGLSRYAKTAVIAQQQPFDLSLLDLTSLPEGFDERTSVELGMFLIALTGGFPPRWLWPATTTGATRADAMYSHIAGTGGGATWHLNMMQRLLGGSPRGTRSVVGKFLPPYLKLVFDYQDDEQDRLQSDIRRTRSKTREKNIATGVTDVRTEREGMLEAGDLTRVQFEELELGDGRLPYGDSVLTLFGSEDALISGFLELGVEEPLLITLNDPLDMLIEIDGAALHVQEFLQQATSSKQQRIARQALAALGKLKEAYQAAIGAEIQAEMEAEGETGEPAEAPPKPPAEEAEEEAEEAPPAEEPLEKAAFDFGAGTGEVIAGQLGRGAGGRFINIQEYRSEMLTRLLGKLRAKQGAGGKRSAAAKRAENQANVEEALELGSGTIAALNSVRGGDTPDDAAVDKMVEKGLAVRNDDGTVSMTKAGRSVMGAGNSGDVDRARTAMKKAEGGGQGKKKPSGGRGGAKKPKPAAERRQDIGERLTGLQEKLAGAKTSAQRKRLQEKIDRLEGKLEELEEKKELEHSKSRADFAFNVRANIRGLWAGHFERFVFIDSMRAGMRRWLRDAWLEGAKECGIAEDELSPAEISAMQTFVNSQFPALIGFSIDVEAGSKANGGKLGPLLARGEMWANQYETAKNQARAMACRDKKLEWRLGEAEHCDSCLKLAGKVKRASWWAEHGIFPRVPGASWLICKGYNCQCTLVPVTFHMSPGPMPRLP